MNKKALVLITFLCFTNLAEAVRPVVDLKLIRMNLLNARRALAEQVVHGTRQVEHIQKTITQIRQLDSYLERFGDPEKVTLAAFNEAVGFLEELGFNKTSEEISRDIQGREIFQQSTDSPYTPLSANIVLEGEVVATRDTEVFKPEVAARRSLTHYREVRSRVLDNRQRIMAEIETSLKQLKAASTASEVSKLNILIRTLESQLEASDREMAFAANEVMTRYFQNLVEERVEEKARVQKERETLRHSVEKDIQTYRLPTRPLYFKKR